MEARTKEVPAAAGSPDLERCFYMEKYVIHGGKPLYGEIEVSGAKNAAVAIIPAALMVNGVCRLENIPQISDADMLLTILEHLGAKVRVVNRNTVEIDCTDVRYTDAPYDLMRKIRASYYLIGAMLGRFGAAKTTMPGGCNFGVRPIDRRLCVRQSPRRQATRHQDLSRQGERGSHNEHHPGGQHGARQDDNRACGQGAAHS